MKDLSTIDLIKNNKALTELIDVHGAELRKLPEDVIEEFRKISNKILDDLAKEDETIAKVYISSNRCMSIPKNEFSR